MNYANHDSSQQARLFIEPVNQYAIPRIMILTFSQLYNRTVYAWMMLIDSTVNCENVRKMMQGIAYWLLVQ